MYFLTLGEFALSSKKLKKPKKVTYSVINRDTNPVLYTTMDHLIASHHTHLAEAKILLAWRYGWKPDADENLQLGHIKKASESKVHGADFIIYLNFEVLNKGDITQRQIEAVLDHQLSHAKAVLEEDGEYKRDEDNHIVYRMAKHDFECFLDVLFRNGPYTDQLKRLVEIIKERSQYIN